MKTSSKITIRTTGNLRRKYSFRKGERLSGKKAISDLFQSGRSVNSYPLRILYIPSTGGSYPATVAIAVPKRNFKRSVERNLLKRRIREAYRLCKPDLYSTLEKNRISLNLIVIYQHDRVVDFSTIQKGLQQGLDLIFQSADNRTASQSN